MRRIHSGNSGWKLDEGVYTVDWECPDVQSNIKQTIDFLTKGCACKKNGCISLRCSCKKKGTQCGPGCQCIGCKNTLTLAHIESESDSECSDESKESEEESEEMNDICTTEVVTEYMDEFEMIDLFDRDI